MDEVNVVTDLWLQRGRDGSLFLGFPGYRAGNKRASDPFQDQGHNGFTVWSFNDDPEIDPALPRFIQNCSGTGSWEAADE
ncbi:hypothetical protein GCM10017710_01700 [Arthrobacter ramosus]